MNNMTPHFFEGSVVAALGNQRANLGITDADVTVMQQDTLWTSNQLGSVHNAIEALCWGAAKVMGLPRIGLSAEYIASCIAIAVHPTNWYLAAYRMADFRPTQLTADAGYDNEREPVTAKQLHAMIQLARTQYDMVERTLVSDLAIAIQTPLPETVPDPV